VLAERADFYRRAHPEADDVHLLIEVSDTTLSRDRAKLRLYATAGMQEVWIVNIDDERIEVYRSPDAGVYIDHAAVGRGERLLCPDFPDVVLTVDEVFG
jgi:Uma2 family endonuclease